MQPKLIFLAGSLIISGLLKAQSFMQSAGASVNVMHAKIANPSESYTITTAFSNVVYFPRIAFLESETSSVSIGAPIGAGISFSKSVYVAESSLYWGVDLPVVADFNFGAKSTPDNDQQFGGYVGGGFGYSYTNWSDGYYVDKIKTYGPIARAGIRVGFGESLPLGLTIGLSYRPGLEAEKFKTYSMQPLLDF